VYVFDEPWQALPISLFLHHSQSVTWVIRRNVVTLHGLRVSILAQEKRHTGWELELDSGLVFQVKVFKHIQFSPFRSKAGGGWYIGNISSYLVGSKKFRGFALQLLGFWVWGMSQWNLGSVIRGSNLGCGGYVGGSQEGTTCKVSETFSWKWLKPRPGSGLDCLICVIFAQYHLTECICSSLSESQLPHKTVNLLFTITD